MRITASTDGDIILVLVGNIINQINLVPKIVAITSDGGTNLACCKVILKSPLWKHGSVWLGKAYNDWKSGVMDVQSDYGRVDTEVTSRNMQQCITCTKKPQKGEMDLETA